MKKNLKVVDDNIFYSFHELVSYLEHDINLDDYESIIITKSKGNPNIFVLELLK